VVLDYESNVVECDILGLQLQCPTAIIPFFGDQPFWGERVSEKGVGPPPIPVSHVTLDKLISAIEFMLDPEVSKSWSTSKDPESSCVFGIPGHVLFLLLSYFSFELRVYLSWSMLLSLPLRQLLKVICRSEDDSAEPE
jgi:hypothetical protein